MREIFRQVTLAIAFPIEAIGEEIIANIADMLAFHADSVHQKRKHDESKQYNKAAGSGPLSEVLSNTRKEDNGNHQKSKQIPGNVNAS